MTHLASFCAPRQNGICKKVGRPQSYSRIPTDIFRLPGEFSGLTATFERCVNSREDGTMSNDFDRRELMALAGLGGLGVAFGSAIAPPAAAQGYSGPANAAPEDFFFVQLSDTH